ncbi:MAG: DegT/DnrJ/EryC1/StrS aminotransferase family protein [Ignavibacteria bacterium]|nr:DegT/DnrJ/EryC1/StrS aminotransferase family protein [Ignavibacteria bacterium]
MRYKIPLYIPSLTGNEKKYIDECMDSTWISSKGKFINEFESKFCEYTGIKHASAVCNGTTALHLALKALGIKNGDEVIVPTFTYIASVSAIIYTGAEPVFADSLRRTWQVDPLDIRGKITSKTKAIMPVHLYGHPCEMDEIMRIADEHKLFVVEDCAEAFGTKYNGKSAGTFGDLSAFSFFGNKTITTGEGGMVATNDSVLHERVNHLKMHAVSKEKEYWHDEIGFNYRMTNICAALGTAQLEHADKIIEKKIMNAELYNKLLAGLPVEPHMESDNAVHSYWMYSILTKNKETRAALRKFLHEEGIETRPTFYPVHTMPMFMNKKVHLPVAEDLAVRGINLPSWPDLKTEDIIYVCDTIKKFFKG